MKNLKPLSEEPSESPLRIEQAKGDNVMAGEEELNTVDDQTTEVVEDQNTDDVSPEDDTLEPSDDTKVTDDTSDEPSPDDTDDGLDEADFIKQYDLPENITTVEEALDYAKNLKDGLLPELKRGQTQDQEKLAQLDVILRQRGYANGVQDVLSGASNTTNRTRDRAETVYLCFGKFTG